MKRRSASVDEGANRARLRLPSSRAVLGALLVVGAATSVLVAHDRASSTPDTRWIVVGSDVPAGRTLTAGDLGSVAIDLPAGVVAVDADDADSVVGRVAARGLGEMELVRPSDLLEPQRFSDPAEVEVMVELSPAAALAGTIHVGDVVNVLSTDPAGLGTSTVVGGARVSRTAAEASGIGSSGGSTVLLAVPDAAAAEALTDAAVRTELTLALPSPSAGGR